MDSLALIRLLSDGGFHSGSELGSALGVSRTAVWKALAQLESYGLVVETIKGKGYRLNQGLELLDGEYIRNVLTEEERSSVGVQVYDRVDSTNTIAMSSVGEESFQLVLAEMQTSGRGRRGRIWQSPFAKNIYLSLGFELGGGPESIAGLSLVAGLSVVKALQHFGELPLKLKWPNDVMLGKKKLAGLLVELQGEPSTAWKVVLGLGLNLYMSDEEAADIDQPWCNLSSFIEFSRNEVVAAISKQLIADIELFRSEGFGQFVEDWSAYDYFSGQEVMVLGSDLFGVSEGVDLLGNLLLRTGDALVSVNAGEVSVRRHEASD